MERESTIHVKGIGTIYQIPDTVIINIEISAKNKIYSSAMKEGYIQVEELKKSLSDFGLNPDELKTVNFNIKPIYEYERDYDYSGRTSIEKNIFSHFDCVQNLKLEFSFDNKKLGTVVDSMIKCPATPKISFNFMIKDISKVYDKVLEAATTDARRKAEILCNASGLKLGKLLLIDCSWDEIVIHNSFNRDCCLSDSNILIGGVGESYYNFNMSEIKVEETVNFSWEIIT